MLRGNTCRSLIRATKLSNSSGFDKHRTRGHTGTQAHAPKECPVKLSTLSAAVLAVGLVPTLPAQMSNGGAKKPPASPPAETSQTVDGKTISIHYSAPSMRGRKIFGDLVPYDKVWRTGANPATTLKTEANLKIGNATVPAGTYTLYTLPSTGTWKLIINKQTGQWGTEYHEDRDLARVDMKKKELSSPQEVMSIELEPFHGKQSSLHVKWDTTDVFVPVVAE